MTVLSPPPATVEEAAAEPRRRMGQRRIRRGWVVAGVLLIVLSALGAASLVRAVGPSQEFLAVSQEVPVGARVEARDLMVVRLHRTPGLEVVPAAAADQVVGRYAAVTLAAGTLVAPAQVTDRPVPGPGEQLVAVPLSGDDLPGGTLRAGDPVLLVSTSGTREGADGPETFPAHVHRVQRAGGRGGGVVVSALVAEEQGPQVAALAAGGRLAVVRLAVGQR